VVEYVRETPGIRCGVVAEARVIGRDQMLSIGTDAAAAVHQRSRRIVGAFLARFAINDGRHIYLNCSI
jgi:hypothetical protein